MADEIDRAQALEADQRADAIAEVRGRQVAGDWRVVSAERCVECDDVIPEARRRLVVGVQLCAACQGERERVALIERRTRGW
ncbi:MAG: TraR/DksA family transcriptional regulator [Betaproteobacteria bacterium]|nr:TraR/DksA family transcriptional regulator [Betaproteobacteria bacterium]